MLALCRTRNRKVFGQIPSIPTRFGTEGSVVRIHSPRPIISGLPGFFAVQVFSSQPASKCRSLAFAFLCVSVAGTIASDYAASRRLDRMGGSGAADAASNRSLRERWGSDSRAPNPSHAPRRVCVITHDNHDDAERASDERGREKQPPRGRPGPGHEAGEDHESEAAHASDGARV
jgi:hypothetical protein